MADETIRFKCVDCGKEIKAPASAAGKRGKCPYCGFSSIVPRPAGEEELLDLAPVDEAGESQMRREIDQAMDQERVLRGEDAAEGDAPLDQREDLKPEDLYHFVVNYCLDLANSNLERAPAQVAKLRKYRMMGKEAVADFLGGKALEPALDVIPVRVLQGFLQQLQQELSNP